MSDTCDPLVEICPEQYGESTSDLIEEANAFVYIHDIEPHNLVWGASMAGLVGYSAWLRYEYETRFEDDSLTWVDRTYTAGVVDD